MDPHDDAIIHALPRCEGVPRGAAAWRAGTGAAAASRRRRARTGGRRRHRGARRHRSAARRVLRPAGPNGAGKTTALGIFTTRVRPTSGARDRGRIRRGRRSRRRQAQHRGGAATAQSRPQPVGAREPPVPRRVLRRDFCGGARARPGAARELRPRGARQRQGEPALRRAAAAADDRARSSTSRASCSSTSPPWVSIRRRGSRCGRSCDGSTARGAPS